MVIRVTNTSAAIAESKRKCQAELAVKLEEWKASGYSAASRKEADDAYKACSDFDEGCPVCLEGRKNFMLALDKMKSGETVEAAAFISRSFTTVRYKWSSFIDRFKSAP